MTKDKNTFILFVNDTSEYKSELDKLLADYKESSVTLATFYKPLVSDIEKRIKYELKLPYYINVEIVVSNHSICFNIRDVKEKKLTTAVTLHRNNNLESMRHGRSAFASAEYTESFEMSYASQNVKEENINALVSLKVLGYISDIIYNKDISDIYAKLLDVCKRYNILEDFTNTKKDLYQNRIAEIKNNRYEIVFSFFDDFFTRNSTIFIQNENSNYLHNSLFGYNRKTPYELKITVNNKDGVVSYRENIKYARNQQMERKKFYRTLLNNIESPEMNRQFNMHQLIN